MIFGKDRMVEEDLERFRRANLPPDQLAALEEKEAAEREHYRQNRAEGKDILAMILAMLSLIGPYVLAFVALMVVFGVLFSN